jgi:hypothetical protein
MYAAKLMPFVLALAPFLSGCKALSYLDFGGVEKEPFELRMGWQHGIHEAKDGTKPGQTDDTGVYKPETPQAEALLAFPNVHAGILGEIQPKARLTPVVNLEVLSAKAPLVGWWEIQVGAGANVVDFYLGKRLLSVWEITVGPCYLRDVQEHAFGWGGIGTVIRF